MYGSSWSLALVVPSIGAAVQTAQAREEVKPQVLWEYERAQTMSLPDVMHASQVRTGFHASITAQLDLAAGYETSIPDLTARRPPA